MSKWNVLFFAILFVIGTDTFLISPLLPELQRQFDISTSASGWMVGAYALGYAVFALIAGPLSDGWDRRKVMLHGIIAFAISTALCGFAEGFWTMFLFRLLAGVSAAFTSPQIWASIPALFPSTKIPQALGIATAGLAVSQALGVPIGSLLAVGHWSYPFFAVGACSLLLAAFIAAAMPSVKPAQPSGKPIAALRRYVPLLASGTARGAFAAYFLFQLGNFGAFSYLGKWMSDGFGLSVGQTGYVMTCLGLGNLVGSLSSARVLQKLGRSRTLLLGLAMLIVCFAILPHLRSAAAAAIAYFLAFAIVGTLFPLMMGLLTALNPNVRGTISSLANSVMYGATTLGAWIAGMLYAAAGGFVPVGWFAVACFAASGLAFVFAGTVHLHRKPTQEPTA